VAFVDIQSSYDSAAQAYAEHLFGELAQKPLDRHLLHRYAEAIGGRGLVADLGCGPGHVSKYLHERGVTMVGIDLSPAMVECAKRLCPGIEFRAGDMRGLDLPDGSLAGIVAFYAIVHLTESALPAVFREWRRLLAPGGLLLLAFHVGDETVHVEDLWGVRVSLDFHFLPVAGVMKALRTAGFTVLKAVEREPYEGAEYPSRRSYLLCRAI